MKCIIKIGYESYVVEGTPTNEDMVKVLNFLRKLRECSVKHTPDYKESRIVVNEKVEKVGISIEPDEDVVTQGEFDKLCAEHPHKEEKQ